MSERPSVTVLGSGSILVTPERNCAGYLLRSPLADDPILIDPGPGTLRRLAEAGVAAGTIARVFVSHFHIDHHADLLALLFARRVPGFDARAKTFTVVAPTGMKRILDAWTSVYGKWIHDPGLTLIELEPGDRFFDDFTLRARRTRHTDHSLCYRFEFPGGKTFTYSGDSDECDELTQAAREADLFACECSLPEEHYVEGHLTPLRAGRVAARARVKNLLLTHFYPPCDRIDVAAECAREFTGNVLVARDLETYEF
jgi:ribonuclease BN (tRNA processing enzyme)